MSSRRWRRRAGITAGTIRARRRSVIPGAIFTSLIVRRCHDLDRTDRTGFAMVRRAGRERLRRGRRAGRLGLRRETTATAAHSRVPHRGDVVRQGAVCAVVIVASLSFATLLRPHAGYASAQSLLVALAVGAGLGVATLILVGFVVRVLVSDRCDRASLRQVMTAWPSMAIVLIILVFAAAGPPVVRAIGVLAGGGGGSKASEQADFRRWQQTVVPIAVAYISAVGKDAVFAHGLPRIRDRGLLTALNNSEKTLARLRQDLASNTARLPSRPELERLTKLLERALTFGERAQQPLLLTAKGLMRGVRNAAGNMLLRRLLARGFRHLQRSADAMAEFTGEANKLGGSLFVQAL